ncbi:MAG: Gx transporter family protein [Clostridiales bacterium]|nr:Gx transporter family protein [Clostridiales bacterium]
MTGFSGKRGGAMPIRRIVTLSSLIAMELALSAIESLIPPFIPLPGIKLGLANIVTLTAFSLMPAGQVFMVVAVRLVLAGLVLGTFLVPAFWLSCCGGLLSFVVMALFTGRRGLSVLGVSLAGAAAHNTGQLLAAAFLLGNRAIFYYLPWLLLWSLPMGLFTGFSARAAIQALSRGGINDKI